MEDQNIKLSELILKSLEGTITREEFVQLDKWLSDAENSKKYIEFMAIHTVLCQPSDYVASLMSPLFLFPIGDDSENFLAEAIERDIQRREEREAEEARRAAEIKKEEVRQYAEKEFEKFKEEERRRLEKLAYKQYRARQRWLIFGITSIAASLILVVTAWIFKEEKTEPLSVPVIAMLDETYNAKWDDPSTPIASGRELYAGPMKLLRGFAKITLNRGSSVIIRGPAEIELENERQVFLQQGTLTAMVPEKDKGFLVRTRNATIVDHGTEFGVIAYDNGETEAHVFKGEVELRSDSGRIRQGGTKRLFAGQAGLVDQRSRITSRPFQSQPDGFVRSMEVARNTEPLVNRNLIVNGDFESDFVPVDPNTTDEKNMSRNIGIFGWRDFSRATVMTYAEIGGGDLTPAERVLVPAPPIKGRNFYVGVENGTITQQVNLTVLSHRTNRREIAYELSGWFGGWRSHSDNAELVVRFLDRFEKEIAVARIGKLTLSERNRQTMFLERSYKGIVPPGTRSVLIELNSYEGFGAADSYADNLKLILRPIN